jgi:outer membrane protein TolC
VNHSPSINHIHAISGGRHKQVLAMLIVAILLGMSACSRSWHRQRADCDAYRLIGSRQVDSLWRIPDRTVEAEPESRLSDPNCADCGPKPLDDEAADRFTRCPDARNNGKYYDRIPTDPVLDHQHWIHHLPRNENGKVVLSEQTVVQIALLHSRDFQTQVESLYLSGLNLASQRFEFQTQWFGGTGTGFDAFSDAPNALRTLATSNQVGFVRALAAGGQFTTSLANSFVWELGSNQFNAANGSLIVGLTQPLLRGAFRHVRLNQLTQAERGLLYDVRDFARFRRAFYRDVILGYLNLLTQIQAKRNQERNLESLQINLDEFSERLSRGLVSQIEYDQVFQNVQNGRIALLGAEQSLENSFDAFKFQLGLPAWVEIELDESLLEPFELSDPKLEKLQADTQALYQQLTQTLPPEVPDRELLVEVHKEMIALQQRAIQMLPGITGDVEAWQSKLNELDPSNVDEDDRLDVIQQKRLSGQVARLVRSIEQDLQSDLEVAEKWDVDDPSTNRKLSDLFFTVDDYLAEGQSQDQTTKEGNVDPEQTKEDEKPKQLTNDQKLIASWTQLTRMLGRRLRERLANMFVAQTQTRLFFIDVKRSDIEQPDAVAYALQNRLDLKNVRAQMTEAFRNVEVAADALQSDLTVSASATLGTDNDNAFRFDSNANRYNVGLQFDGPLNRFNEGNAYRASQIAYQASRRAVMATEDGITNQIRADLRALRISRLNFQIGRQQLISSIRQVDEAQIRLRTATDGTSDSSPTQDLLNALSGLLAAKNSLISNRIGHEIARINLFVDLELLYLDDQGTWLNQDSDPAVYAVSSRFETASTPETEQFSDSIDSSDELPNDSETRSDYDESAPQPEFEPDTGSSQDGAQPDTADVELTPPETGLKLEQPKLEIESSPINAGRETGS